MRTHDQTFDFQHFRTDLIPTYELEGTGKEVFLSRPRNTHTIIVHRAWDAQRMEVVIRINALIAITFSFDPWKTDTRGANARPCREAILERERERETDRLNAV